MNVVRLVVPALVVGGALSLGSAPAAAYSAPTAPALCDPVTCQVISVGSGDRSAQAIFEISGSSLFVTLANTSILDVQEPVDVLTALLFNLNYSNGEAVTLSPLSALMTPHADSGVEFDALTIDANLPGKTCEGVVNVVAGTGCDTSNHNVGGEWDYASGNFTGTFTGFTKGISSAGLGPFGEADFGGPNLEGPTGVDGGQYGITSAGDDPSTNINGTAYNPVTKNAVQFALTLGSANGRTLDLSASGALSAGFQWGTTQGVPGTFIPIPGTLALLGLGAFGLCWMRRRQVA